MSTREAMQDRDQVLDEIAAAKRRIVDAGMEVLREFAAKGRPFSANDARSALRAVGCDRYTTGAVFKAAEKARIIRSVGAVTSNSRSTHGKAVARYIAADQRTPLEALTVPVVRDPAGRFTNNDTPSGALPLFDLTPEGNAS